MIRQNPVQRLAQFDQSVWLDFIERSFVLGGGLAQLVSEDGVSGVTSNPAIFHKAIAEGGSYDGSIAALAGAGLAVHEVLEALVIEDIRNAADVLAEVYANTAGSDGFVSLEVSPHLARDAEGTYSEAQRLWTLVARPNLMIKVPGTIQGIAAIRRLIAVGINVNVTLLFSVERYATVAAAFIAGLQDRRAVGLPVDRVASVASFFLSRIDTLVDARLEASHGPEMRSLLGTSAVACAQAAYGKFLDTMAGSSWRELLAHGARPQRLLWASTGAKNPAYSDVKYVDELVGPETVTTVPPETLVAYRDHGNPARRLSATAAEPQAHLAQIVHRLAAAGIEWDAVAPQLEEEGIRKFVEPYDATLAALSARMAAKG